jgi:hypothetical protein
MTQAEQAVELIRKLGVMRSTEIEAELGIQSAASVLQLKVADGTLITCKVERPGKPPVNEYRISAAEGRPPHVFSPLKTSPLSTPKRDEALVHGTGLNGHDALTRGAELGRKQPEAPKPPAPAAPAEGALRIGPIEKAVPMPTRNNNGVVRAALAEMAISDMRRIEGCTKQAIQYAAKVAGVKIRMQLDGESAFKVWRVE